MKCIYTQILLFKYLLFANVAEMPTGNERKQENSPTNYVESKTSSFTPSSQNSCINPYHTTPICGQSTAVTYMLQYGRTLQGMAGPAQKNINRTLLNRIFRTGMVLDVDARGEQFARCLQVMEDG